MTVNRLRQQPRLGIELGSRLTSVVPSYGSQNVDMVASSSYFKLVVVEDYLWESINYYQQPHKVDVLYIYCTYITRHVD